GNVPQISVVSSPSVGQLTPNGDGTYTYVPASDYAGPDSFTYQASDGILDGNIATVTIYVNKQVPTVVVTDSGGAYTGSTFDATAMVAGVDNMLAANLEGVTPILTYYVGSDTSGTELSGAPSNAGAYTVVASFAGSIDYTSTANVPVTFTI